MLKIKITNAGEIDKLLTRQNNTINYPVNNQTQNTYISANLLQPCGRLIH